MACVGFNTKTEGDDVLLRGNVCRLIEIANNKITDDIHQNSMAINPIEIDRPTANLITTVVVIYSPDNPSYVIPLPSVSLRLREITRRAPNSLCVFASLRETRASLIIDTGVQGRRLAPKPLVKHRGLGVLRGKTPARQSPSQVRDLLCHSVAASLSPFRDFRVFRGHPTRANDSPPGFRLDATLPIPLRYRRTEPAED